MSNLPVHLAINATYLQQGKILYTLGAQNVESVQHVDILLPVAIFDQTPQPIVQLDVDLLTFNGSVPIQEKGFSVYIDFLDSLGVHHSSFIYNGLTTYPVSSSSLHWSDTLSLSGVPTEGLQVVPLRANIYFAGDEAIEADFKLKLSLTRINVYN